jgi:CubicO group peptidase (beta-lactamase class C family)
MSLRRDDTTLRDMIERLAGEPLMFAPGTRWSYGISTDVVGYLVEVLSGQTFDAYLRDHIFDPLGMPDTGFDVDPRAADRLAAVYAKTTGGLDLVDDPAESRLLEPATYFSGAGGLVSTVPDYLRFVRMLLGDGALDGERVIGRKTLRFMLENHLPAGRTLAEHGGMPPGTSPGELNMDANGFGLGFSVRVEAAPGAVGSLGEYGWWGAFGTIFWVDPREDLAVIFMTQRQLGLIGGGIWGPVTPPIRPLVYGALG